MSEDTKTQETSQTVNAEVVNDNETYFSKALQKFQGGTCPSCGYCPTCGRSTSPTFGGNDFWPFYGFPHQTITWLR